MASFQSVLRLNGSSDIVEIPFVVPVKPSRFTLSCWARVQGGQGSWRIPVCLRDDSSSNRYAFYAGTGNQWHFYIEGSASDSIAGSLVTLNAWTHLAATYDSTKLKLYVNGNLVAQKDTATPYTISRIQIGSFGGSYPFAGEVAEVCFWNRVRTLEEIHQDMFHILVGNEPGLLGYWPLSEGSGDKAFDKSSKGNSGTIKGGTWQQQISIKSPEPSVNHFSSALKFDGVDDHIVLPAMNIDYSRGITIEAWVRFNSFKTNSRMIDFSNGAGSSNIILFNVGITNGLQFSVFRGSSQSYFIVEGLLEIGRWIHIAATVDTSGKGRIYANGKLVKVADLPLPENINRAYNYIGKSIWSSDGYFDGQVVEVRLWNRPRSQQELQQTLYRRLAGNEADLVGYWPLNEGAGNTAVTDRCINANHGTISGATWQQQLFIEPIEVHATEVKAASPSVLSFDGKDDYVEFPGKCVQTGNEITIAFWAYGGASLPKQNSILQALEKSAAIMLNIHLPWVTGEVYFDCGNASSYDRIAKAAPATEYKGKWTHWAFTKNVATGEMKIYLNGELWHSEGNRKVPIAQADKLAIGSRLSPTLDNYYHGMMQELSIWNRALSPDEIKQNMNCRLVGNEPNLMGYWPLNDGTGTIVRDKTRWGNHGTIKGATWQQQENFLQPAEQQPIYARSLLAFNGKDSCVNLGKKPVFKIEQTITLEAWVFVEKEGSWNGIVSNLFYTGSNLSGYGLCLDDQNSAAFCLLPHDLNSGADTLKLNWWHHVAGTYDGKNLKIYINGLEKASQAVVNFKINYTPENDLLIGMDRDDDEVNVLKGRIAEVRLWNHARTAEEIQQAMYHQLANNEEGLVGYWPLDDGWGNTTSDRTSNGSQGAITLATWEEQIFLQAANQQRPFSSVLVFDGQDDCIEVAAHPNPTTAITVALWAKSGTTNWNQGGCLASKRDAYVLHPEAGSKELSFYIHVAGSWQGVKYTPSVDITQWHHYVGAFDGKTLRLYFDGAEVAKLPIAGTINADKGPLYIGLDDGSGRYLNGQIADVSIWNRPLSKEEIQKQMNVRLVGNEPGLVGYWPLNEGAGTIASDKSTFANHGQIKGGAIWQRQLFVSSVEARATLEAKIAAEKAAAEIKVATEAKVTAEAKAAVEKAAAEEMKAALEKALAEAKAALEAKAAAEKATAEAKAAAEKAIADKEGAEKAAVEARAATDKAVAEKQAAEKTAATDKQAAEKAIADKEAAERQTADAKASAEKAAAEVQAATAAKVAAEAKAEAEKAAAAAEIAEVKAAAAKKAEKAVAEALAAEARAKAAEAATKAQAAAEKAQGVKEETDTKISEIDVNKAKQRLLCSTGLEDYGYWWQQMLKEAKPDKESTTPSRGRIWR